MISRTSNSLLMACTASALLLSAVPSIAQDQTQAADSGTLLPTLQVLGTGPAGAESDTPLATQTTDEEIRQREITSISDLGNTTEPGVDFSQRTSGAVIRGLSGPRIATLVDGIPLPYIENFARGGGGPTGAITNSDGGGDSFDFSSLSALDVLRGADSSRIGSGALGGALVLRTLEPGDIIEGDRTWGAITKATYDSRDSSLTGSAAFATRFGATSALLQGSYKHGNETKSNGSVGDDGRTRTKANPLDLDQSNILFKLRHDLEGGHQIGMTAERFERDIDSALRSDWTVLQGTGATQYFYPVDGYYGYDGTRRERVSLDYNFVSPEAGSGLDYARATAYWQRLTKNAGAVGTQVRTATGAEIPYMRDNRLQEEAFGFTGDLLGSFDTGTLGHQVRAGLSIATFNTTHYIAGIPNTVEQSDIPETDGMRIGAYIEDRIAFGDSGFALTPGLRFDWHDYRPKANPEFANQNPGFPIFGLPDNHSDSRFSPKLLATYDVTPNFQVFGQWSAAYRAPTVNELYLNFTNVTTGYAQMGNPDLKPETGHGFEAGVNAGDESFGARMTVFHNRYRNFITTTPLTPDPAYPNLRFGVGKFINLDEVHTTGVELKAHKLFDNGIRLHGGLAYTYGRDVAAGTRLREVAPIKAIAGIGYDQQHWGVDLTGIFAGGVRDDGDPNTFDAPSYAIANITGWWEPEQVKGMRIQAGVYNVFDTTYFDAVGTRDLNLNAASSQPRDFYSEPGRSFKISLTQKF